MDTAKTACHYGGRESEDVLRLPIGISKNGSQTSSNGNAMQLPMRWCVSFSLLLASSAILASPKEFTIADKAFHLGETAQKSLFHTNEYFTFDRCSNRVDFVASDSVGEAQAKMVIDATSQFTATITRRPSDIGRFAPSSEVATQQDVLLWCNGAIHTWIGKFSYGGYVFDSSETAPLQFKVTKESGYVYVGGKGSVTGPKGKAIRLPPQVNRRK